MMRRWCLLGAAVCLLLLSGCGGQQQLSRLAVVTAMGLDETESGSLQLTCEIGRQSQGEYQAEGKQLAAQAATLPQALALAAEGSPLQLSHVESLVISQSLLQYNLDDLLEYWLHDPQLGVRTRLVVARDCPASGALSGQSFEGQVPGLALRQLLQQEHERGRAADAPLVSFWQQEDVAVPAVTMRGETVTLDGCALLHDGQCQGFLEQELVPGLLLLTGESRTAQIPVKAQQIFELDGARCQLIPALEDGRLVVTARLSAQARTLFGDESGARQALETLLVQTMEQCRQCGVDALGLQALLQREYPEIWQQVEGDWQQTFAQMETSAQADLTWR